MDASWEELGRNEEIARAWSAEISADAMRCGASTTPPEPVIRKLVERGRREGTLRADVPADLLVTNCPALIHAAAEEIRTGANAAPGALAVTGADLCVVRRAMSGNHGTLTFCVVDAGP